MVASKRNPGSGIKGINEPKKFTSPRPKYPTSGDIGNNAEKSTDLPDSRDYLIKANEIIADKSHLRNH
jgi:hypothetical protein